MTSASELAGELMGVTASIRRVTRRHVRAGFEQPPLPEAQRELMLVVHRSPGIGVAAAANELGVAGNTVSTLVNALVEAGLLVREVDPADRRAARLVLTAPARQRIEAWRGARSAFVGAALERLPDDDRRRIEAALPALRALLTELGKAGIDE
jgi:DNA-binding MarR family transcriptional regulator